MFKSNALIRVLYLITANTYGGAEHAVYKLVCNLDRAVFLPFVACLGNNPVFISRLEEKGVKVFPLNMKTVLDVRIIPKLYRILKNENIDIIHTQLFKSDFYGRITGKLAGTKVIISTIQNMESFRNFKILNLADRLTSYLTYKIITVSDVVKDFTVLKTGLSPDKFITIYNFVDTDDRSYKVSLSGKEKVKEELGLDKDNIVIGTVGRMAPQKSQVDFLLAASEVIKKNPNARFIIAGDGPLKDDLISEADRLSLKGKVLFTGFVSNIHKIFSAMDIFVLSSRWEGLPLSICEAMAHKLPVVSTRAGGVSEIVEDGITGITTDIGDVKQLADGISMLAFDGDLRFRMAEAAKVVVEEKFSLRKILKETEELYLEAAGNEKGKDTLRN